MVTCKRWCLCLVLLSVSVSAQAPDATRFELLRDKAINGDHTIDFTDLRLSFAHTPEYDPDTPMAAYRVLWAVMSSGDFAKAISTAESVLIKDFVDINAHMVAALAYRQTGDLARAQFHRFIADGLLASVKASGDGKTPETAFQVIATSEEYALVVRAMGLRPLKVGSGRRGDHFLDTFVAHDPRTDADATFYFDVGTAFESKSK
jgi:hypothetical protein